CCTPIPVSCDVGECPGEVMLSYKTGGNQQQRWKYDRKYLKQHVAWHAFAAFAVVIDNPDPRGRESMAHPRELIRWLAEPRREDSPSSGRPWSRAWPGEPGQRRGPRPRGRLPGEALPRGTHADPCATRKPRTLPGRSRWRYQPDKHRRCV